MKRFWMQLFMLAALFLSLINSAQAQIIVPAGGCVMETFDGANPWFFGGNNSSWTWANPNKAEITDDITGGGKALILGGNAVSSWVNPNEDSWAESPIYNLSAVNSPYIEFWFYHSNEASTNYDEIWMEYSLNGGSNWQILSAPVGTNNCYDQNWYNYLDNWGGATAAAACCTNTGNCNFGGGIGPSGWMLVRKCVAGALANQPNVIFRFRSNNGTICNYYGATIDNFSVCDAKMIADFDYNCLGNYQVEFLDGSEKCPNQWRWDFGDGVSDTLQNPVHSYAGPGTYTVTLIATATAAVTAGCGGPLVDTISYTLTVLDGMASTLSNTTCNGGDDGIATMTVVGGTPPYNFAWSHGANTQTATGLTPGVYTVTVSSGAACPASSAITITEPSAITLTTSSSPTSCGSGTGSMSVSASGGGGGFSYSWSNGATSANVTGVYDGTYIVSVTDANGCVVADLAVVTTSGTTISVASTLTDATCNGSNGIIDLTPTSGTAPYTYIWSNGATTQDLSGLIAQTYSVTTTDVGGCNNVLNLTIGLIGPSDLLTDSIQNLSCNGVGDGAINISLVGNPPFNYLWSNAATTEDLSGLSAGTYTITVVDGNNCQTAETFFVTEPSAIIITTDSLRNAICGVLGTIQLSVAGGAPGYSYLWSNGASSQDISGLGAGIYTLTVSDADACQVVRNYSINDFPMPILQIDSIIQVSCHAGQDGAIFSSITSGNPPFNYLWSNGETTANLTALAMGLYSLTLSDSAGCTLTRAINVIEPTALALQVATINATCVNNDGIAIAAINGGSGGYNFAWSNGATTQTATGLYSPSAVSVTVTDVNACAISSFSNAIGLDTTLRLTPILANLDCTADPIGSINIVPTNGALPYTYVWSTGATTDAIDNLAAGTYSVTLTDDSGCSITDAISITSPLIPTINAYFVNAGILDSTIFLTETIDIYSGNDQSALGVSYQWTVEPLSADYQNANAPNTFITPIELGTYNLLLVATSLDGCTDSSRLNLIVEPIDIPQFPTAFTPNNDVLNDQFRILELDNANVLDFQIFNRWGQVVFNNADGSAAWDGNFQGSPQPREVYIYVLTFQRRTDATAITIRGQVTLLR